MLLRSKVRGRKRRCAEDENDDSASVRTETDSEAEVTPLRRRAAHSLLQLSAARGDVELHAVLESLARDPGLLHASPDEYARSVAVLEAHHRALFALAVLPEV